VYSGPSHSYKVNKLSEMTSYDFRIFASNVAGSGPYSETYTFTTTKAPPPSLKGNILYVMCKNNRQMSIGVSQI